MKRLLPAVCLLLMLSVSAVAADVTGTWNGTFASSSPDGTSRSDPAMLMLKQTDGKVTGTLGPNESQQLPITEATLKENKLTIQYAVGPQSVTLDLTIDGDRMTGTVTSRSGTPPADGKANERTGKVELVKAK